MDNKEQTRWRPSSPLILIIFSFISYGTVHYTTFEFLDKIDYSLETASKNTILSNFKNENLLNTKTIPIPTSYTHEANVFRSLLGRTKLVANECRDIVLNTSDPSAENKPEAGEKMLPERGVQTVLEKWLNTHDYGKKRGYPTCTLPPPKSCNVTSYSVIIMSHTVQDTHRLTKLFGGIQSLSFRPGTAEIILVWNSERELLHNATHKMARKLLYYANDTSHPLRIFYSLENGLENNLLNRYNPIIKPTQELVMYFDDDGPFFTDEAMTSGMDLWRFNSDTQVGSFPRNLRLSSSRMKSLQKSAAELAVGQAEEDAWQTHVSPNDGAEVEAHRRNGGAEDGGFPKFIPLCHGETGDTVEYNYNLFPNFEAHMFLPSGTFLHRNYLCFIWHPVFTELRQFILDHPTHPDDMVISTLVSHLSGRGLRTFTRRVLSQKDEAPTLKRKRKLQEGVNVYESRRRRLLWEQDKWGDKREDAINLILNYFGSINPGSIGWCTGTQYFTKGKDSLYECTPLYPKQKDIPWMNEGGLGYNQCP